MFTVTAQRLRLTASERTELRRAGLEASDLRHLTADDVLAATGEAIGRDRAVELVALAEMISVGVGTDHAITLRRLGVTCCSDLATRDPGDLFVAHLASSARTHPHAYDAFCRAVYLARGDIDEPSRLHQLTWTRERERAGFDPLVLYWRHCHGNARLPTPTSQRFRAPTIGTSAPIVAGQFDDRGEPTMPIAQRDVSRVDGEAGLICVGHWSWNGGHGAFFRLEELLAGDGVQVANEWYAVRSVELTSEANGPLPRADLVLTTPAHRRVGLIGTEETVRPVERGVLRCVVAGVRATRESADTTRRPIPRRAAAY